jgi:hypothetical protein
MLINLIIILLFFDQFNVLKNIFFNISVNTLNETLL